ncbi:diiron oxygenase [Actinomadura craniellae]|uniref:Diiron oxygenase n=1 Tax=Actinomadura craniellae TaxID=2231787 RepID=A0A365GV10_9ACTN|nr:diiron oxygenase [Actinomadura craniellae]RAY10630.1 diiron oxygenase [Actinomadura craniellae]
MNESPTGLDEEIREKLTDRASYLGVIDRLNKASVDKHWEAYADIPWGDPEFQVDPTDPRWILPETDRLGSTTWYRSQPEDVQARIGLWRVATAMKIGLQFENLLKRGLLTYAYRLPNGRPEFRYVYHETTEECHHGMMFQEFVNRTGMPIRGMPKSLDATAQLAPLIPRLSTELFFIFVLGGEDPIDYVQRKALKDGHITHPLEEKIMRIHVAEEARHISFARHYLRNRVPRIHPVRRRMLGLATPVIIGLMARIMLSPPGPMVRHFGIPRDVVREAYKNDAAQEEIRNCVAKIRDLAAELGLLTPASRVLWRAFGIWDEPVQRSRRALPAA